MKTSIACVLSFAAASSYGCAYAGSGFGELRGPPTGTSASQQTGGPVEFSWQSGSSAGRGTIEAQFPDGRRFRGTYVQPSSSDGPSPHVPTWSGITSPRWAIEAPWCDGSRHSTAVYQLGPVLAHLESRDGTRMRCVFALFEPSSGLSGGGQGDCQLSTREEVFDALLHTSPEG